MQLFGQGAGLSIEGHAGMQCMQVERDTWTTKELLHLPIVLIVDTHLISQFSSINTLASAHFRVRGELI